MAPNVSSITILKSCLSFLFIFSEAVGVLNIPPSQTRFWIHMKYISIITTDNMSGMTYLYVNLSNRILRLNTWVFGLLTMLCYGGLHCCKTEDQSPENASRKALEILSGENRPHPLFSVDMCSCYIHNPLPMASLTHWYAFHTCHFGTCHASSTRDKVCSCNTKW